MEENKTQSSEEVEAEKVSSSEEHSQASSSEKKPDPADVEKNKTMAILSYFIFFLPLLTDSKDSEFAKFHANQSLVLLIFAFVGNFVAGALTVVLIGFLLLPVVGIMTMVFWILGLINASNGEMKRLPLIGGIDIIK